MFSSIIKRSTINLARRAAVSSAMRLAPRVATTNMISNRFYSESTGKIKEQLKQVLSHEIEISNEEAAEFDGAELEQFLESSKFKVLETPGNCDVQLVKELPSGETIRVFFNVDAVTDLPVDGLDPEEYDQVMAEGLEQQLDNLDALLCNVNVLIEKPDNTGIFVTLLLKGGEERFEIERIEYKDNASKFVEESIANNEFSDVDYPGPRFVTLDEALQTTFEEYLESVGVDSDLAAFIIFFSDSKEEKEYNRWISKLGDFFKN